MTPERVDSLITAILRSRVSVEAEIPGEHDLSRWFDPDRLREEIGVEKAKTDKLYWTFTRSARGKPPPVEAYERGHVLNRALVSRWAVRVGDGVTVVRVTPPARETL